MSKKRSINDDSSIPTKRKHLSEVNKDTTENSVDNDLSRRCGKILKIHLTNFMCHSNLKIELCNRVNLIIGSNGSGKSAILTALVVGLGAKARDTNRSTSIKQLVKSGENAADIDITILNSGPEAYEPEVYGNNITISRHILASGSSSYKIRDCRGNIISRKADDLHKILLYHNIQTDNPVFVLNQDSARSFLKEMEPSKNYVLFLKATQIESILEKLNQCGVMYRDYKYRLSCYKRQVDIMEKELDELREKQDRLESADEIKRRADNYKLELVWLKVQEQEKVLTVQKDVIAKFENKLKKVKQSISEKDIAEQAFKTQISEYENQYTEKNSSFRSKLEMLSKLKNIWKVAAEKFEQKLYQCKKTKSKIDELKKQIQCYQERIEERSGSGLTQVQKLRTENERQLTGFLANKENINILIGQQKRELDLLNETKDRQEEEFENLNRQRIKLSEKIVNSEKEILKIKSSSANQFSAYGPDMSAFVDEINRNKKKFSETPIGPLGQYIYVSNQKWRGPIELLLGGLLTCFIVNNDRDFKTLTMIKNKFPGIRNSIITMRFQNQVYDVSSGVCHPPNGSTLLMNEIKCDNPIVINCLIDRSKIETILLTEDQTLGINLTAYKDNVPENLSRIILLNPFLEYYPAPMYRAYSLQEKSPRYIQVNMEEIRKQLEIEIDKYKGARTATESELRSWKIKITDIYRQIKKNQDVLAKHQASMNSINEKIEEIKSFEYPEETQIEFLKNEITALQESIKSHELKVTQLEEECELLNKEKVDKTSEYEQQKQTIANQEEEVKEIKKSIDELKSQLHSVVNFANSGQENLQKITETIAVSHDKFKVELNTLNEMIGNAESFGKRITVTKNEEELKRLVKKYEFSLKKILTTDENLSDVIAIIKEKQLRYENFKTFTESIIQTLDLLKKSRIQRFNYIISLKNRMALRVRFTFDNILKIKNFTGKIEFDHKEEKLTLTVIPRDNHINNAVSNTKSLSGGERSFSTVALLLSLWSCVDHPFYFLDEYDVFTDQVNREIMTKLLISEAEKKPHRQYSFLTPQDVSFVQASDTIVIHRLAEPRR